MTWQTAGSGAAIKDEDEDEELQAEDNENVENRKLIHWLLYTQSIAFAFGAVGTSEN